MDNIATEKALTIIGYTFASFIMGGLIGRMAKMHYDIIDLQASVNTLLTLNDIKTKIKDLESDAD